MTSSPQPAQVAHPSLTAHARGVRVALACAAAGLALVYVAGFAQMEALHNGAHDARHAAALPCH
jgi:cobalt transporter subunit CbtB